jgi:HSP20 family protein
VPWQSPVMNLGQSSPNCRMRSTGCSANLNDGESSSATADWMPAVDVREYVDRFELLVDLPGVDPKVVEITLDNSVLSLSGERRDGQTLAKNNGGEALQQRRERRVGRFHRRFILPDTVDAENVKATEKMGSWQSPLPNRRQPRQGAFRSADS